MMRWKGKSRKLIVKIKMSEVEVEIGVSIE